MKERHLNFFECIIQANIRKEAESIPLVAFEFWSEKEIKKAFEEELENFIYNDPSSEIERSEKGIIMLMIAMIRKLLNLCKLPIEDQREHLISEQEDILFSLNLKDDYIMSLIKNDVENDDFAVENKFYKS